LPPGTLRCPSGWIPSWTTELLMMAGANGEAAVAASDRAIPPRASAAAFRDCALGLSDACPVPSGARVLGACSEQAAPSAATSTAAVERRTLRFRICTLQCGLWWVRKGAAGTSRSASSGRAPERVDRGGSGGCAGRGVEETPRHRARRWSSRPRAHGPRSRTDATIRRPDGIAGDRPPARNDVSLDNTSACAQRTYADTLQKHAAGATAVWCPYHIGTAAGWRWMVPAPAGAGARGLQPW